MRLLDALLNDVILPPLPPGDPVGLDPIETAIHDAQLKEWLGPAHCIDATNVNEFFEATYRGPEGKGGKALFEDLKCLVPPFSHTFIEWNTATTPAPGGTEPMPMIPDSKKMGVLLLGTKSHQAAGVYRQIIQGRGGDETMAFINKWAANPLCGWILLGFDFIEFNKNPDHFTPLRGPYTVYTMAVGADGSYMELRTGMLTQSLSTKDEWQQVTICGLAAFLALALLNCRNIETVRQEPPAKLNKARKRRGKKPYVGWSTIRVNQSATPKGSTAPALSADGAEKRLHAVRGHMKRYRGKGLFGKYAGVWYWGPQLRGSEDEGVVLSEHVVEPPTPDGGDK